MAPYIIFKLTVIITWALSYNSPVCSYSSFIVSKITFVNHLAEFVGNIHFYCLLFTVTISGSSRGGGGFLSLTGTLGMWVCDCVCVAIQLGNMLACWGGGGGIFPMQRMHWNACRRIFVITCHFSLYCCTRTQSMQANNPQWKVLTKPQSQIPNIYFRKENNKCERPSLLF